MEGWTDFCVAQIGASAALAGLVFVGITINMDKILAMPPLPNRALGAILALATVLAQCSILLAPHQSALRAGITILALALAFWLALATLQVRTYRATPHQYRYWHLIHIAVAQLAALSFILAGSMTLAIGAGGLDWFLPGVLLCYAAALYKVSPAVLSPMSYFDSP